MPPFRRVGAVLKERFDGATEVAYLSSPTFVRPVHTKDDNENYRPNYNVYFISVSHLPRRLASLQFHFKWASAFNSDDSDWFSVL